MDVCFRCNTKTPIPDMKICSMCRKFICKKCGGVRYGVYACKMHFEVK